MRQDVIETATTPKVTAPQKNTVNILMYIYLNPLLNSFSDQLKRIIYEYHPSLTSVARGAGIHLQSLSRFMHSSLNKPAGIEAAVLERLWSYLEVWIVKENASDGEVEGSRHEGDTFAEQFRSAIDYYRERPGRIARASDVSPSVLSLFMRGRRKGLSIASIDKIWEYLFLEIGWTGATRGFQYAEGSRNLADSNDIDIPF